MLKLLITGKECWDEGKQQFVTINSEEVELEHSLLALSAWESKWHVPFLSYEQKTAEQVIDYVRCMAVKPPKDENIFLCLTDNQMKQINEYIDNPMTATTFSETDKHGKREIITSEIMYYWLSACQLPIEIERWHLNRFFTLIRVCSIKNAPPKKMSKKDVMSQNRALNRARRAKHHSRG